MLTKGDVLAFLGKASTPTGTFNESAFSTSPVPPEEVTEVAKPLDGTDIRRLIMAGLLESVKPRAAGKCYRHLRCWH